MGALIFGGVNRWACVCVCVCVCVVSRTDGVYTSKANWRVGEDSRDWSSPKPKTKREAVEYVGKLYQHRLVLIEVEVNMI